MCLYCRSSWEGLLVVTPLYYLDIYWETLRAQLHRPLYMACYTKAHHPLSFHRGPPHLNTTTVACILQEVSALHVAASFYQWALIHPTCVGPVDNICQTSRVILFFSLKSKAFLLVISPCCQNTLMYTGLSVRDLLYSNR